MNTFQKYFAGALGSVALVGGTAHAAALDFTLTDATGTITNIATGVGTIGVAMLGIALAVRGFSAFRKA